MSAPQCSLTDFLNEMDEILDKIENNSYGTQPEVYKKVCHVVNGLLVYSGLPPRQRKNTTSPKNAFSDPVVIDFLTIVLNELNTLCYRQNINILPYEIEEISKNNADPIPMEIKSDPEWAEEPPMKRSRESPVHHHLQDEKIMSALTRRQRGLTPCRRLRNQRSRRAKKRRANEKRKEREAQEKRTKENLKN